MRSWDPAWEQVFRTQSWGRYPGEPLIRFIARNLYRRDRARTRVLEVGCGPGANLWYLAREGFSVSGIDASSTAVRQAQERLSEEGVTADIRLGDILQLPWPDAYFDAAVDIECLFVNDTEAAEKILREIRRTLAPGGLLFSQTLGAEMAAPGAPEGPRRLEYLDARAGPHAGKGFMRLSDAQSLRALYGRSFDILSLEKMMRFADDGSVRTSEWLIECRRKD